MLRGYDPVREEVHWRFICYGIILGLLTAAIWYSTVQVLSVLGPIDLDLSRSVQGFVWLFFVPVALIVGEVIIFLHARKTRARNLHLRMGALAGTAPVCSPPSLAPLSVTLPYTVRIRMHINKGLLKSYRRTIFYILVVAGFLFIIDENFSEWRIMTPALIFLLIEPAWFVWTLVQAGWESPTLILNDEGITARYWGDRVTMRWADVRFFAITGKSGQGSNVAFELSDGEHIIRWLDVFTTKRADTYIPAMEPALYKTLMQTLPHWICTRTDQPLYDLRIP